METTEIILTFFVIYSGIMTQQCIEFYRKKRQAESERDSAIDEKTYIYRRFNGAQRELVRLQGVVGRVYEAAQETPPDSIKSPYEEYYDDPW